MTTPLNNIHQQPQDQRSLLDQLTSLVPYADRLGLYDAADFLRNSLDAAHYRQRLKYQSITTV